MKNIILASTLALALSSVVSCGNYNTSPHASYDQYCGDYNEYESMAESERLCDSNTRIYFGFAQDKLRKKAEYEKIESLAQCVAKNAGAITQVTITGYTDASGTEEFDNCKLAKERSENVKTYLINAVQGIDDEYLDDNSGKSPYVGNSALLEKIVVSGECSSSENKSDDDVDIDPRRDPEKYAIEDGKVVDTKENAKQRRVEIEISYSSFLDNNENQ